MNFRPLRHLSVNPLGFLKDRGGWKSCQTAGPL
jgi:hypothetical protein